MREEEGGGRRDINVFTLCLWLEYRRMVGGVWEVTVSMIYHIPPVRE